MSKATKKAPAKRKAASKAAPPESEMTSYLAHGSPVGADSIAYVLRACKADMSSRNDFLWPVSGKVEAPDWSPSAECGHGLHGWLWGEGDVDACDAAVREDSKSRWLVVAVWSADVVQIDRKVKFPRGWVVFCGDRSDATSEIVRLGAKGPVIYGTATAGYAGTATAGYAGTATAGYAGTATAGDAGTATAGYAGTATAGYAGTATAGYAGTATAGDAGVIVIKRWDGKRHRLHIAYVGEGGIEPNVAYRLQDDGTFVRADGAK